METDRLAEEKARGLSITLGFAWRDYPGVGVEFLADLALHERAVGEHREVARQVGMRPDDQAGLIEAGRLADGGEREAERRESGLRREGGSHGIKKGGRCFDRPQNTPPNGGASGWKL